MSSICLPRHPAVAYLFLVRLQIMRTAFITFFAAAPVLAAGNCGLLATSSDFEHGAADWYLTGEIVADPLRAANHVAALHGTPPAAMAPIAVPSSVDAVEVRFRVLAPRTCRLR